MRWDEAKHHLQATYEADVRHAWAAGFFDGEGSIVASRTRRGGATIRLAAVQVVREPLDQLAEMYGGTVSLRKRTKAEWAPVHVWQRSGAKGVRDALSRMLPQLRVKRVQADIAVAFCERQIIYQGTSRAFGQRTISAAEVDAREALLDALAMVKRGESPPKLPEPLDPKAIARAWAEDNGTWEALPATAREAAIAAGVGMEAMHLRLRRLEQLGLVNAERDGRRGIVYARASETPTSEGL